MSLCTTVLKIVAHNVCFEIIRLEHFFCVINFNAAVCQVRLLTLVLGLIMMLKLTDKPGRRPRAYRHSSSGV